jgi:hypothetical protein
VYDSWAILEYLIPDGWPARLEILSLLTLADAFSMPRF